MRFLTNLISLPQRLILGMLWLYQHTLSPDHGWGRVLWPSAGCKYFPSCSEYTRQSIVNFGLSRGIFLSIKRILKCHPWSHGGYDPVPHPTTL